MDKKMKYCLLGAVLSGMLIELCCYLELLPTLTTVLKAIYVIFTVGFTFLMIKFLAGPETDTQAEPA
jgi:hypothetical protein